MPKSRFVTKPDNLPPNTTEKVLKSKEKYQLTNWTQYDNTLVNRRFASLWSTEKTLAQ